MKKVYLGLLFFLVCCGSVYSQTAKKDYNYIINDLIAEMEGNEIYSIKKIDDWGGKIEGGKINCTFYEVTRDSTIVGVAMKYAKTKNGEGTQRMFCLPMPATSRYWSDTVKAIGENVSGTDINMINYALMMFAMDSKY